MTGARVDADGVHLPAAWQDVLEVAFDGRRIWALRPDRYDVAADGMRHVAWPGGMRSRLDGVAEVSLRSFASGEVLDSRTVRFGSGSGRVEFVSASGDLLEVNKWGELAKSFQSQSEEALSTLLDGVRTVLDALHDDLGLDAFLSYGMLLGAVRSGKVIGHDGDADVSYVSRHQHPTDVLRENFAVERHLRGRGWRVRRVNGGFLQLFVPMPSGAWINLDIYACAFIDGNFYQVHEVMAPLSRGDVLPVSEIVLEGRTFPAPAKPELMLELCYGPGWRVPDPAFKFATPAHVARRIHGWWGGYAVRRQPWGQFHTGPGVADVRRTPTPFARWVLEREASHADAATRIVDIGCGSGRDAVFFARHRLRVLAVDFSPAALRRTRRLASRRLRRRGRGARKRRLVVEHLDLGDVRATLLLGARLARDPRPPALYSRLLPSALEDADRARLWRLASMALRRGGRLYVEFHAPGGERRPTTGVAPVRRLEPARVAAEIEQAGGQVEYIGPGDATEASAGEGPLCRLVAHWAPVSEPHPPTEPPTQVCVGVAAEERPALSRRAAVVHRAADVLGAVPGPTRRWGRLREAQRTVDEVMRQVQRHRRSYRELAEVVDLVDQVLVPECLADEEGDRAKYAAPT